MEALFLGRRLALTVLRRHNLTEQKWRHLGKCFYSKNTSSWNKKYKEFKDEEAPEILDVFEERLKMAETLTQGKVEAQLPELEEESERVAQLSVEEIIDVILENSGKDLVTLHLPPELNYVDFLLIVTGKSRRHIKGLGEIIRKYAKDRLDDIGNVPQLEGGDSEWIALDLGNICIHIMGSSLREAYDLESLWSVGAKYDIKSHQQDDKILKLLKKHTHSSFGTNTGSLTFQESLPNKAATI